MASLECKTIEPVTAGAFTEIFTNPTAPQWLGGVPPWLTGLVVSLVVLTYVFMGGSRGAAYANTFQTIVFMVMGLVAFVYIINGLGGLNQTGKLPARITETGSVVQDYRFDKQSGVLVKNEKPKAIGQVIDFEDTNLVDKQPHLSRTPVKIEFKKKNPKTGEISAFEREL